jgi:hypothetical protein
LYQKRMGQKQKTPPRSFQRIFKFLRPWPTGILVL